MKLKIPYLIIVFLLAISIAQCADDGSEDYSKAIISLQRDECEKALEYVNKAIETDPTNITYLELRGDILQREGKYQDAIDSYDMVLNLNCELIDVRYKICNTLYRMKDYDKTIACCKANQQIAPNHKESIDLKNVAEIAKWGGIRIDDWEGINESVYQEILDSYEKAIAIDNNYSSAWNNKGVLQGKLEMYNDSIACFNETIRINSSSSSVAIAWNNKGVSLDLLGRDEESLECYDKAIELNPQFAEALHNKCVILLRILPFNDTNYLKAISYCDRAKDIDPGMKYQGLLYKDDV